MNKLTFCALIVFLPKRFFLYKQVKVFIFLHFAEISTELICERSLIDVWNSEFLTKILNILDSSDFFGCMLKLRYELRFEAHEFTQVYPWLFSTAFATPNIPVNLTNNDYRSMMCAKAVENPYVS